MKLSIRPYVPEDAGSLTDIFYDSIHAIGSESYSAAQRQAWAPQPKDYGYWQQRLNQKPPFVAEVEGQIVGFMTLEANGHIDWTYTHKDFQRRGIASALYAYLESAARTQRIESLWVEASLLAKPFFAKRGFHVVRQNDTKRLGEILINYTMEKSLKKAKGESAP